MRQSQIMFITLWSKESLGRMMRIQGQLELLGKAYPATFEDFGKHLKKESEEITDRLEKIISIMEDEKDIQERIEKQNEKDLD